MTRSRYVRTLAVTLAAAVAGSSVTGTPAGAAPPAGERWPLTAERSTPGRDATTTRPSTPDADGRAALAGARSVSWPRAGSAVLPSDGARVADVPVTVKAAGGPAVRVEVLDRAVTARAGREGLLLRVAAADREATVAATVRLDVDYSGFRHAYGGDWAGRLRLVALPECALSTPELAACAGTPLPTRNDVAAGRLSADVAAGAGALFAVTAGEQSNSGTFAATPLAASATWNGGGSSGDFTWNYPLRVPPAPGELVPELALAYSSSSVDGRHPATNNQPSFIGEGFEMWPGFLERRYRPCADDMGGGASNTTKTGDQCWATDNATVSMNGMAGELVRDDATGAWRLRTDNGARIERFTGAANGDNDGEYWKITATDGTQYFFGLGRLPGWAGGHPETNATWTVPVYGNHSGEPCRQSTFDASYCAQAWRWNLDYVVDRHGDTMSYFYTPETNRYGRNLDPQKVSVYTRGGYIDRIEYGQRDGAVYTSPAVGRVLFDVADRCVPGTTCVKTDKAHFPDVPYDRECAAAPCTDKHTPTFWTAKRLARVRTQVWSGTAHTDVDSWTLRHSYPDPGDGTRAGLWLDGITHTGHVGGTATLPELTFSGVQKPNRVDGIDNIPAMNWWRISAIHSENGGEMAITYSGPDCAAPGNLPAAPDSNTKRCMPVRWTPEGLSERLDWFHKYVVTQVTEHDRTSGLQPVVTNYEYVGGAAWRHADDDGLTQPKDKTWSMFRGYERVKVRKGHPDDGPVSLTETRYLRGMHGDKLAAGGTKTSVLTPAEGPAVTDEDALAGQVLEEVTYLGDSTTEVSRKVTHPWLSPVTATAVHPWGTRTARAVAPGTVTERTALEAGGFRRTVSETRYDTSPGRVGIVTATNNLGDTATTVDDSCVRYTYAPNLARWLLRVPSRIETVGVSCDATAAQGDVQSDIRNYYDGNSTLGAIDQGDLTRSEELVGWNGTTPVYRDQGRSTHDVHGRTVEEWDAAGAKTTTAYTPATGGPVTRVTTTNPLGHAATTELAPAWGEETAVVDANGRRVDAELDPLGRTSRVWHSGRIRGTDSPSVEYGYLVRTDGPNVITTRTLRPDGVHHTSYSLFDGLARPRQTQAPAPGGGRVVSDTIYNSRGEVAKNNGPYYNDAPPGFAVLVPEEAQLPAQTQIVYDGAGRSIHSIFKVQGTEKWRSSTGYGGDRTHSTPAVGGTATTTVTDARGRTVELRQYHGPVPTGTFDATRYTYTRTGELSTVTDPAGNVWRYFYDLDGNKTRDEDPDRGVTTYTHDAVGRLATQTDSRNRTLAYAYDAVGRKTAVHGGSLTGPKLAEWTYDTVAKGQLASSTRYSAGSAYTRRIAAYDAGYRPASVEIVIPAAEGSLAGTYRYDTSYHPDGALATATLPELGGLAAETLNYGYASGFSLVSSIGSEVGNYVTSASYTPYGEPWQVKASTDPTGATKWVTTTYEYHIGSRRLGRTVVERDGTPMRLSNASYTWDAAGNLTKISDQATGVATDAQCFGYDHLRRLATAWTPVSGSCTFAPSAGALGGPAPYYHSWTFDKTGNRLTETRHAAAGNTVATSTYPAAGTAQPHTLRSVATVGPGVNRIDSYGYDSAGNTTGRTAGGVAQVLEWDAEGHLAKLTQAGVTSTFLYDADGNRLLRRDGTDTTVYLGPDELRRTAATGALSATRYYTHNDKAVAVRTTAGGLYWLAADHHGTHGITVRAGDMAVQRRYATPYGGPRGPVPPAWPGERGFVGGQTDPSGLTHLGVREYDPTIGRFLSVDPLMDLNNPQQLNGYAYADNNPTTASDPDGRWPRFSCDWSWCKKVRQVASSVGNGIRNTWNDTMDWLDTKRRQFTTWAGNQIKRIADGVKKTYEDLRKKYNETKRKVIDWAKRQKPLVDKVKKWAGDQIKKGLNKTWTGIKKYYQVLWQTVRTVINGPVSLITWGLAEAWGADCGWNWSHMIAVCKNVSPWMYNRGGTTIGSIFLTGNKTPDDRMLSHEEKHADQWALGGGMFGFPIAYGLAEWISGGGEKNPYERWADLEDGCYHHRPGC